jgi:hypothetical protein
MRWKSMRMRGHGGPVVGIVDGWIGHVGIPILRGGMMSALRDKIGAVSLGRVSRGGTRRRSIERLRRELALLRMVGEDAVGDRR